MQSYGAATLIYVYKSKTGNGSPKEETITRFMKVRRDRNFSLNYYVTLGGAQREMRNSMNLVVPTEATKDIIKDGKRYELLYVDYQERRYRVRQILNYYKSGIRWILDCEELK